MPLSLTATRHGRCFAGGAGCVKLNRGLWVIVSREAAVPAKKYVMWVAVAFAAFYVIKQPDGAGQSVADAASGLASAAGSVTTFIEALG